MGSVEQITPMSTKRSSKERWDTEEILKLLKVGNEQTKKTLEQIDSTLSASTPDMKKSWCLWMEANVKQIDPVFVEVLPVLVLRDVCCDLAELLLKTSGATVHLVPILPRVSSSALSSASGS